MEAHINQIAIRIPVLNPHYIALFAFLATSLEKNVIPAPRVIVYNTLPMLNTNLLEYGQKY